ncbi:hypothetical protein E2C01_065102 [Portunus trituberculatus]|uniref:Uncharacterized protein n=1 Tax=Portunus trituberculatus TaxID=210409 RepID=A0A5B7HDK9_PORTR|nr:hypothetical protein [Portunus trituberculatus]
MKPSRPGRTSSGRVTSLLGGIRMSSDLHSPTRHPAQHLGSSQHPSTTTRTLTSTKTTHTNLLHPDIYHSSHPSLYFFVSPTISSPFKPATLRFSAFVCLQPSFIWPTYTPSSHHFGLQFHSSQSVYLEASTIQLNVLFITLPQSLHTTQPSPANVYLVCLGLHPRQPGAPSLLRSVRWRPRQGHSRLVTQFRGSLSDKDGRMRMGVMIVMDVWTGRGKDSLIHVK